MLNFKEDFLQFIWKNKLLLPLPLLSVSGKTIQLIRTGELNSDSGPDFFNAAISLDGLQLVGNIEVHLYSSDWLKHKHQLDRNYDNIILHVVYEHNLKLKQNADYNVEVLELKPLISQNIIEAYRQLSGNKNKLPCAKQLPTINELKFVTWLQRMQIERLESKVERISEIFKSSGNNYTQTFYTLLLRSFGSKVNALPFELLAGQLPLTVLLKHADNLMQLEALLLGTSGLLEKQYSHSYVTLLQNEYEFLRQKYNIIPLQKELFKFSRMRPANFPDHKLMQFAALVNQSPDLFLRPEQLDNYESLFEKFKIQPSDYAAGHYKLDGKALNKTLKTGSASIENAMINVFAPFFFFYAKKTGKEEFVTIALNLLEECRFESNVKTKLFAARIELLKSAGDSQGLIHLFDNYCVPKKCLNCGLGTAILNRG